MCQLCCVSEVRKLYCSIFTNEDVVAFDIPVHDVVVVEELQAREGLNTYPLAELLTYSALHVFEHGRDRTAIHYFQENPEPVAVVEALIALDNPLVVATSEHDPNLIQNIAALFGCLWLHELKRAELAVLFALDLENLGKAANPNTFDDVVVLGWVLHFEVEMDFGSRLLVT